MNALRAFESAARHGSFTRASEELSVAQPAVTRHVNNLEAWLGVAVFTRHGNRISLTPEGQDLARLATSTLDRLELGLRDVIASKEEELRIGASFGVTHLWLMPRISEMRKAAQTTINFLTSDNYRDFDDRSVDASIRFGNGKFDTNVADLLFPHACQIIASPAFLAAYPRFDPLRLKDTIAPEHMFDHGDPHNHGWMTWSSFAADTGQTPLDKTQFQSVASYPMMLDMICAGEGIGIGYRGLEETLIQNKQIVRVGPVVRRPDQGYFLVYRPDVSQKGAFKRLRQHLLSRDGAQLSAD